MNPRLLELALKKQRLQFQSAVLRQHWARHVQGVRPVLAAVDGVGRGVAWFRQYPYVLMGVAALVAVARSRVLMRWWRRGWIAWKLWQQTVRLRHREWKPY